MGNLSSTKILGNFLKQSAYGAQGLIIENKTVDFDCPRKLHPLKICMYIVSKIKINVPVYH